MKTSRSNIDNLDNSESIPLTISNDKKIKESTSLETRSIKKKSTEINQSESKKKKLGNVPVEQSGERQNTAANTLENQILKVKALIDEKYSTIESNEAKIISFLEKEKVDLFVDRFKMNAQLEQAKESFSHLFQQHSQLNQRMIQSDTIIARLIAENNQKNALILQLQNANKELKNLIQKNPQEKSPMVPSNQQLQTCTYPDPKKGNTTLLQGNSIFQPPNQNEKHNLLVATKKSSSLNPKI